jgi:hypothetical protein
MTKQTGHHQPRSKRPLVYDSDGCHASELLELALDHPFWFWVVCCMIDLGLSDRWIIGLMRRIV